MSENAVYLDLTGNSTSADTVSQFESLPIREKSGTLLKNMRYFTVKGGQNKKPEMITHWIVADLDVPVGRKMLKAALDQMVFLSSFDSVCGPAIKHIQNECNFMCIDFQKSSAGIRVSVIVNPMSSSVAPITELIVTALGVLEPHVAATYIQKILENEEVFEALDGFRRPPDFLLPVNRMILI